MRKAVLTFFSLLEFLLSLFFLGAAALSLWIASRIRQSGDFHGMHSAGQAGWGAVECFVFAAIFCCGGYVTYRLRGPGTSN